jgi:hypothetical protein
MLGVSIKTLVVGIKPTKKEDVFRDAPRKKYGVLVSIPRF